MSKAQRLITIFTPSHADADATNAQRLTVKEIVAPFRELACAAAGDS